MKKVLLFLVAMTMLLAACEKDDYSSEKEDAFWSDTNATTGNNSYQATITKLYSVVMRRELPYPFKAYVMELNNQRYFYMMRTRFNADLHVGDRISFQTLSYCPSEISSINGYELGNGTDAQQNSNTGAGQYLVASDPIEATVKSMFAMKIRYTITFLPIDTWFIETTAGNLIFIKKSKLNIDLKAGDKIVYNVYTLYPNEVLALKKL